MSVRCITTKNLCELQVCFSSFQACFPSQIRSSIQALCTVLFRQVSLRYFADSKRKLDTERLAEPPSCNWKGEMHDDRRAMCIMKPLLYLRYKDEYATVNLKKKRENKGTKQVRAGLKLCSFARKSKVLPRYHVCLKLYSELVNERIRTVMFKP